MAAYKLKQYSLCETFDYKEGHLYRRLQTQGSRIGKIFGALSGKRKGRHSEYITGHFNGKQCLEHRLIWELCNGEIPKDAEIDHLDHDGTNNKLSNLRLVTRRLNARNLPLFRINKSGICGVYWSKHRKIWIAQVWTNNASRYLGSFDNLFDAAACRISFNNRSDFHINHGRAMDGHSSASN